MSTKRALVCDLCGVEAADDDRPAGTAKDWGNLQYYVGSILTVRRLDLCPNCRSDFEAADWFRKMANP